MTFGCKKFKQVKVIEVETSEEESPTKELCKLCLKDLDSLTKSKITLSQCDHIFHKKCLKQYFLKQTESATTQAVHCPNQNCNAKITDTDHTHLHPDAADAVPHSTEMMKCPSSDCNYTFASKPGHTDFTCKQCLKRYCLKCKTLHHFGMTCFEFEVQKDINKFAMEEARHEISEPEEGEADYRRGCMVTQMA